MTRNLGRTSLKGRRRRGDPMRDYDLLPLPLRRWLSSAALPWRPRSVRQAYARALARTRDAELALQELDRIEARLISADARKVWGSDHPAVANR